MEIKLEVSDSQFKELVEEGINGLTHEDKERIIKEGIAEYLSSNPEIFEKILFRKDYYSNRIELTKEGHELITKCIDESDLTELKDYIKNMLKKEGSDLIVEALSKTFIDSLAKSTEVQSAIQEASATTICKIQYALRERGINIDSI